MPSRFDSTAKGDYVSTLSLYLCYRKWMDSNGTVSVRCIYLYSNFVAHSLCMCVMHCNSDQEIRREFTVYYYGTVLL